MGSGVTCPCTGRVLFLHDIDMYPFVSFEENMKIYGSTAQGHSDIRSSSMQWAIVYSDVESLPHTHTREARAAEGHMNLRMQRTHRQILSSSKWRTAEARAPERVHATSRSLTERVPSVPRSMLWLYHTPQNLLEHVSRMAASLCARRLPVVS